jgi:hypothetical protein
VGRVIVSEFLTLDGVMEAPENWQFPYVSDNVAAHTSQIISKNRSVPPSFLYKTTPLVLSDATNRDDERQKLSG